MSVTSGTGSPLTGNSVITGNPDLSAPLPTKAYYDGAVAAQAAAEAAAERAEAAAETTGSPIVILATGQSNITVTPSFAWAPPGNVVKWDWSYGVEASVGTQFLPLDATKINASWRFAAEVARDNPTRAVYLINIAWSAQTIAHWKSGASSPDVFQIILNNVPNALAAIGVDHIDLMLWWQGESDCLAGSTSYQTDFETVMSRFKGETWFPTDTPIVVFGISATGIGGSGDRDGFNVTLQKCVDADADNRVFTYAPSAVSGEWTSGSGYNDMTALGYYEVGRIAYENWQHGTGRNRPSGHFRNYGTNDDEIAGSLFISGSSAGRSFKSPANNTIKAQHLISGLGSANAGHATVIPAGAANTGVYGDVVFDGRSSAHWPSQGVWAPNDGDLLGFSWEGGNSVGFVKSLSNPIGFKIGSTEVGRFKTTGLDLPTGQIAFPATQNPSSNANTLDDYEEGTFTPGLSFTTPGDLAVVYSNQTASYTKIGRCVCYTLLIQTSSFTYSTAASHLRITGFPFPANSNFVGAGSAAVRGYTKAGYIPVQVETGASSSFYILVGTSGASSIELVAGDVPSGGTVQIYASGNYNAS